MTVFIYALCEEDFEPRYVGKSIRPYERLRNHINEAPSNCHRSHWIQSLKARGIEPVLTILERLHPDDDWRQREKEWIAELRSVGWNLTNNTDGGDGVSGLPEATRARMRQTWLGRKHRPETIEKLKVSRPGFRHTEETKARMRIVHSDRIITWGDKLAAANRKLSSDQEEEIARRLASGERVTDLAKELGLHRTTVSKVKKGTYRGR